MCLGSVTEIPFRAFFYCLDNDSKSQSEVIHRLVAVNGGGEGNRTPCLRMANATLSQPSYVPTRIMLNRSWQFGKQTGCMVEAAQITQVIEHGCRS
jgi:hypothetical protein